MKKTLVIFSLIFLLSIPVYSNAEKFFKGLKGNVFSTAANITAVYTGPNFPGAIINNQVVY